MKEDSHGVRQVVLFLVYRAVYAPLVLGSEWQEKLAGLC